MRDKFAIETGKGFWMPSDIAGTLRAEGENRPSRPSCVVIRFYENHAQDSRVRRIPNVAFTIGSANANSCSGGGAFGIKDSHMKTNCKFVCVVDMMGGKTGAHFSQQNVSPAILKGRASVNDIHLVCHITRKGQGETDEK